MKLQVVSFNIVSGGPEALHQLASAARTFGVDARMVYWPLGSQGLPTPAYSSYCVPVDLWIDDDPTVTLVVPETLPLLVHQIRRARVNIWWLSVDYYVHEWVARGPLQRTAEVVGLRPRAFNVRRRNQRILHFAQSEYARLFLEKNDKAGRTYMLTDYLGDKFLASADDTLGSDSRGARVAFNPRKGSQQMQQLMAYAPVHIEFMPLQGLTPAGVKTALMRCAVYVDFGHHPGRDRIPREAAVCGCNVITGRRGAAANDVDIPIDSRFKIDESAPDFLVVALGQIQDACANYTSVRPLFDAYRHTIKRQRDVFFEQVGQVLRALDD